MLALLAGSAGGAGNADATGAGASFSRPKAVAVDIAGNVYVADSSNNTIRKISSTAVVTTLAGTAGVSGSADDIGAAASFNNPSSVAVDNSGNVYVADTYNGAIRKITSSGVVTTLAGTAAAFGYPDGIAVDSVGNIYVSDSINGIIRKITPGGIVTALAGTAGIWGSADGTGAAASFYLPSAVAVDSAGNVYVADSGNNTIRKIASGGVVTTLAGTAGVFGSTDGTGASASFSNPNGIAVDNAGYIYVSDNNNRTIRKITSGGVVTTLAGTAGVYGSANGIGESASFGDPQGVAVDSAGNVYVAEPNNNIIRKITLGNVVTTLAGTAGAFGSANGTGAAARFFVPAGVAVDSGGSVYVSETYNRTLRKITSGGVVTTLAGTAGVIGSSDGTGVSASFCDLLGVAIDSAGNLYVSDSCNSTIRKITSGGVVTTFAGTSGIHGSADGTGAAASFGRPNGITVDSADNVYVTDTYNSNIRKITPSGVVTTLAGNAGVIGSTDGTGAAASFGYPNGIAVDSVGNVYVSDSDNNTIRKITSGGVVTTIAGTAGVSGNSNGTGAAASFNIPTGVTVDSVGNVYVADTGNNIIRKISSSGNVTTVAGKVGSIGFTPGPLPGALRQLYGIAISNQDLVFTTGAAVATISPLP